jgi:hypothetical protein
MSPSLSKMFLMCRSVVDSVITSSPAIARLLSPLATSAATSRSRGVSGSVRTGAHVTSVGYMPPGTELDLELLDSARLFVETRIAFEPPPAGCVDLQGLDPQRGTHRSPVCRNMDDALAGAT